MRLMNQRDGDYGDKWPARYVDLIANGTRAYGEQYLVLVINLW